MLSAPFSLSSLLVEVSEKELYSFQKIETKQFVPTDEYIQKCVEAPAVRQFLEDLVTESQYTSSQDSRPYMVQVPRRPSLDLGTRRHQ